jgi:hypothetical protein
MLERPELLIRPDTAGHRVIFDAAGESALGKVALNSDPLWLGGRPRRVVVTEGADASLVFVVRRRWLGRTWEVAEADDNPVAWLRGGYLLTADGRVLGRYHAAAAGGGGRCRGWDGAEWAAWSAAGDEVRLRFGDAIRGDPFLRMAALACAWVG